MLGAPCRVGRRRFDAPGARLMANWPEANLFKVIWLAENWSDFGNSLSQCTAPRAQASPGRRGRAMARAANFKSFGLRARNWSERFLCWDLQYPR